MSATGDDSPRPVKRRRLDVEDAGRLLTIDASVDNTDIDTPSKQDDTPRQLRSSARQRRPPQRFEQQSSTPTRQGPNRARQTTSTSRGSTPGTSQVEIALRNDTGDASRVVTTSPLKGILTPSRKNRSQSRPRKTVVFDNDEAEIEQRLGFKNLDRSVKKQKAVFSVPTPKLREENIDLTPVEDIEGIEEEIVVQTESPQHDAEQTNYYHGRTARLNGKDCVDDVSLQFRTARATVLRRLTGVCSTHLPVPTHLRQAYKTLHSLLTATVSTSESNSLLLLGPRGAGKSMLLEQTVSDLTRQHGHDSFYTVRLSGFLQTDDRLALREIWRQLGKELTAVNSEEDHVQDTTSSYADVMTSLLTLLSHPDEQLIEDENGAVRTHDEGRVAKSTIFILDEFDLFTTHPRQTLLYNLFDIAQSRKAPIAVVGCSSRMDVVDGLEKRVKSRFSQRWVFVPPPRSLGDWDDVVRSVLRTSTGRAEIDLMTMSQAEQQSVEQWDGFIDVRSAITRHSCIETNDDCVENPSLFHRCSKSLTSVFLQYQGSARLFHRTVSHRRRTGSVESTKPWTPSKHNIHTTVSSRQSQNVTVSSHLAAHIPLSTRDNPLPARHKLQPRVRALHRARDACADATVRSRRHLGLGKLEDLGTRRGQAGLAGIK